MPTGKANRTDEVLGRTVPVDIPIQTGDKSWAGTTGVQGFKRIKRVNVYGAASYLLNPRNTTGVRSFFASLRAPNTTTLNSASDQYSTQIGASVRVKNSWPVPSIGYCLEGVLVRDVFGASDGFRRPGSFGLLGLSGHAFPFHPCSFGLAVQSAISTVNSRSGVDSLASNCGEASRLTWR